MEISKEARHESPLAGALAGACGSDAVHISEPMKEHTTFRIGGPADYFVTPHTAGEIRELSGIARQYGADVYIMGNGSNLLVSDQGIRGVVIRLGREFGAVRVEGTTIFAQAGALLSGVAAAALEAELTGFEFAAGIPGTVGGACLMNAGAYGGEMKQVLKSVQVLTPQGEIKVRGPEEMGLSYRHSAFMEDGSVILEAEIGLSKGKAEDIKAVMEDLKKRRQEKQPLDLPSAGSTFRRPEGYVAGKLIRDAGLAGLSCGGARVSEKHCGFIVNTGGATASDVKTLIEDVRSRVLDAYGVELFPEIRFLGDFA